ncbi:MAG: FHA domain-containing protein [Deltaproteobacteria bacterium]|nr:FHA domain-containing protein [Deltaproteobacteria bacterium]
MGETVVFGQHQKMVPPLKLVVVPGRSMGSGEAPLGGTPLEFLVFFGRQSYGRGPDNEIILDHPTVSKRHGVIDYHKEGEVIFYDLSSLNGISFNGKKKPVVSIKKGQSIQVGGIYLKLVGGDDHYGARPATPLRWMKSKKQWIAVTAVISLMSGFSFLAWSQMETRKENSAPLAEFVTPGASALPLTRPPELALPLSPTLPLPQGLPSVAKGEGSKVRSYPKQRMVSILPRESQRRYR